jgi:extradiol dioxygenase family protein
MALSSFHLAFPVDDLAETRAFYCGVLGCSEGRSDKDWVDFDFYGHQIVAYRVPGEARKRITSPVDGDDVPVRHFGLVLSMADWEKMRHRLVAAGTQFVIEPQLRFEGTIGEQAAMFFLDPSGNAIEFKAFKDPAKLFAK